jgi:LysR family transcriptional regulator, transcriptional activator of nhaA
VEWLNYHHLLYFWTVAREGSIARASVALRLAQPTISAQIRTLEEQLGEKLFERRGRGLALTETGRVAFRYADEIFSLGRELLDVVKGRSPGRPVRFSVGVSDVVPKLVAHRLLEPALRLAEPVRIVCHEDHLDALLARLALHELDLVISDAPIGPHVKVRGFSHALGECGVRVFGTAALAAARRRGFPGSLEGAPMLLPTEGSALRRSLDAWFEQRGIRPLVVGEFEDSALLKTFASEGAGLFVGAAAIEREIRAQYGVKSVGSLDGVTERFYAISAERRLTHPAVRAITEAARGELFAAS